MTTVISVEKLSKVYRLGQIGTGTFSRDLNMWWAKARGKPNPFLRIGETDHGNRDGQDLWALNDVSFTVKQGEVLGIIGKNGAGKSTLLKILSRVTAPTSGRVRVKGRIASLLEVGTGFHPELTGRENIYLNGAILGMSRGEIDRKFDEIVDFSGVEKFIDTPVKRYSSGMYVRLAFAVAAHLEPEILLVDEVLAVGDAEFQKKCLGKMGKIAKEGRTVLFVSHNMAAVSDLTRRCLWLEGGSVLDDGKTDEMVNRYLEQSLTWSTKEGYADLTDLTRYPISGQRSRFVWIRIINADGKQSSTFVEQEPITIKIGFSVVKPVSTIQLGCGIVRLDRSFELFTVPSQKFDDGFESGDYSTELVLSPNYLREGFYSINLKLFANGIRQETLRETIKYYVSKKPVGTDDSYYQRWVNGPLIFKYEWEDIQSGDL